jgi:hypothetical protein
MVWRPSSRVAVVLQGFVFVAERRLTTLDAPLSMIVVDEESKTIRSLVLDFIQT